MSIQIATSTHLLIQERNKLRILWQRTHNIALRPRIDDLKEEIDRAIKTQLCNNWHQTLQNRASNNMQDTWRITKHLTNKTTNITPLKRNENLATAEQEKAKLFADTLQEIFTTNAYVIPTFSKTTEETVCKFFNQSFTQSVRRTNHHELG
jgi:Lon protease-like protein